jgi:hypothetical protein
VRVGEVDVHLHDDVRTPVQRDAEAVAVRVSQARFGRPVQHLDIAQLPADPLGDGAGAILAAVVADDHPRSGELEPGCPEERLDVLCLLVRRHDQGDTKPRAGSTTRTTPALTHEPSPRLPIPQTRRARR